MRKLFDIEYCEAPKGREYLDLFDMINNGFLSIEDERRVGDSHLVTFRYSISEKVVPEVFDFQLNPKEFGEVVDAIAKKEGME